MSVTRFLAGFAVGAAIGAVAGILLAPKSGEETREMLGDMAAEISKKTDARVKDIQKKADDIVSDVQERAKKSCQNLMICLAKKAKAKLKYVLIVNEKEEAARWLPLFVLPMLREIRKEILFSRHSELFYRLRFGVKNALKDTFGALLRFRCKSFVTISGDFSSKWYNCFVVILSV